MLSMNHPQERSNKPKNFILKVYEMVNNSKYADIIAWTETGYSFAIFNITRFASTVLPVYFKHKNFSSFVRQLNMYDFHKERDTGEIQIFSHPCFIRAHPERLSQVIRKVTEVSSVSHEPSSTEKKYHIMQSKHKILQKKLSFIEKSFKDMSSYNQCLMTQLVQCMDREQKVENFLVMLIQQLKEVPSAIETCYMNIMGPEMNKPMTLPYQPDFFRFSSL